MWQNGWQVVPAVFLFVDTKLAGGPVNSSLLNGRGGDGYYPLGGVVRDTAGNLYGTTSAGDSYAFGTGYKLSSTGFSVLLHTKWIVFGVADYRLM